MEFKIVRTLVQANFWLEKGDVLSTLVKNEAILYLRKTRENVYKATYQPDYGSCSEFTARKKDFDDALSELFLRGYIFVVSPGAEVRQGELRKRDRVADWFRSKFKRRREKND